MLIAKLGCTPERLILAKDGEQLDLKEVGAVWYRRVAIAESIPMTMDVQLRDASIQESCATIQGMIASLNAFHLDLVHLIRHASNKQLQLQVARSLGIETPQTLTTNNPLAVGEFVGECPQGAIVKMLSSFAIYEEEEEKVVFTNLVKPEDLEDLEGLRFCPMTFQELIPKALELRTTIAGQQIFTAAIDSQKSQKARYDWRRRGLALINDWQPYDLPQELSEKLLQLMDYFGLHYGAIDIILTPDDRHVFLEINPVGEFFWLDRCPGLPISQAIADTLLSHSSW
ncbi:MAG: MvdD family ATP-grasp ribosomal peptide maturase [Hormoscilla sp. GUM202]|nr:MvdD family ATP-grasp ribosomal peptide maturase [Hormoscilla sp. GUM202]